MAPVALNHAWWKRTTGIAQNLPTCDVLWSSKSEMMMLVPTGQAVITNPFYIPFVNGSESVGDAGSNWMTNTNRQPSGFTHWLVPSRFTHCTMYIQVNEIDNDFDVFLGEDGPTPDGLFGAYPGNPRKKRKLFNVPATSDVTYTDKWEWEGPTAEMFSGHSYGYIFELKDEPVVPTSGKLSFWMSASIFFGAAGN
jgi:hypothetical protein